MASVADVKREAAAPIVATVELTERELTRAFEFQQSKEDDQAGGTIESAGGEAGRNHPRQTDVGDSPLDLVALSPRASLGPGAGPQSSAGSPPETSKAALLEHHLRDEAAWLSAHGHRERFETAQAFPDRVAARSGQGSYEVAEVAYGKAADRLTAILSDVEGGGDGG